MVKKPSKSNTVSYFDLRSPSKSKKSKSQSRSRSTSRSPKRSNNNNNVTKKNQPPTKSRSKSLDGRGSKPGKTQSVVKTPVRTGNIPSNHKDGKKKTDHKDNLPKDLVEARFRGKKILIFKNSNDSNLVEEPFPLAVSEHSYPTFDSLLEYLNQKLTLHSGRINKLYKIQGGEINELKQLRDKGWYVASNGLYMPPVDQKEGGKKITKKFIYGSKKNPKKSDISTHEKDHHLLTAFNKARQDESDSEYDEYKETKPAKKHNQIRGIHKTASEPDNISTMSTYRKPPVPKFQGRKKSINFKDESESVGKTTNPNRISSKQKHEAPFGRMGTLGSYIRSHRPGSLKRTLKQKQEEEDEIVSKPLERSLSSQSARRNSNSTKFEFGHNNDKDDFYQNSRPRSASRASLRENNFNTTNNYWTDEEEKNDNRSFARGVGSANRANSRQRFQFNEEQDEFVENSRSRSARRRYSTTKSIQRDYEEQEDTLIQEPSELEPMNKIMYPSGYRPPSRKDAASSAKALKQDAAVSARSTRNSYSGEALQRDKGGRRRNSEDYQEDLYNGRDRQRKNSMDFDDDYYRDRQKNGQRGGQYENENNSATYERRENMRRNYSPDGRNGYDRNYDDDYYKRSSKPYHDDRYGY